MAVQKCCLTLGWDTIGWDNISQDVQILGIDLSPVGEIFVLFTISDIFHKEYLARRQRKLTPKDTRSVPIWDFRMF